MEVALSFLFCRLLLSLAIVFHSCQGRTLVISPDQRVYFELENSKVTRCDIHWLLVARSLIQFDSSCLFSISKTYPQIPAQENYPLNAGEQISSRSTGVPGLNLSWRILRIPPRGNARPRYFPSDLWSLAGFKSTRKVGDSDWSCFRKLARSIRPRDEWMDQHAAFPINKLSRGGALDTRKASSNEAWLSIESPEVATSSSLCAARVAAAPGEGRSAVGGRGIVQGRP